eukprot:s674_g21.t1
MGAVKLEHSDPAQHRACIMQQLRKFWMEDHLCDVVLKSSDGTEHGAHTAVLSAASVFFKNMLGGTFMEAERVQQKQPVEIAASKEALFALLDYIYDGQPEVPIEVGLELLRLAEAYNLPKLARDIEAGIRACLDGSVALEILQEAHGLHSLRAACEDKVAEDFETCSKHPDFLKLSREEAVVNAIFAWLKISSDRHALLGLLLHNVDFQSLSIENLLRLGRATLPGPSGDDLHREVDDALTSRKRIRSSDTFQSKRRGLQHWSPFFGASTAAIAASGREVLSVPHFVVCMQWHNGEIYALGYRTSIFSWKPGDPASCVRRVTGEAAAMTGINDLGSSCHMCISPNGEMFVSASHNRRLVRFENGSGHPVRFENVRFENGEALFCSPNGVLYVTSHFSTKLQKLVGSSLETVLASESLPAELQFKASRVFATKEEMIYLVDILNENHRILRINPAESLEPVVVGRIPSPAFLSDLFVTDGGTIYVAEPYQSKVFVFHPSSPTFRGVLKCPDGLQPVALLVQDRSLYVSMLTPRVNEEPKSGKLYEYVLPPDLQLHE